MEDNNLVEPNFSVRNSATPELMGFLGKQGIPWQVFQAGRKPISEAYNRQETRSSQRVSNVMALGETHRRRIML